MATVKESVKESLLGATREPNLSAQTKAVFTRNSTRDEQTGESFMTRDDFIRAVAPDDEDYVSVTALVPVGSAPSPGSSGGHLRGERLADLATSALCSTRSRGSNMPSSSTLRTGGETAG